MLRLTKKSDYGLIALRHLAVCSRGTASAKEISDAYGIPLPLLAKVLQKLTRGRLTSSVAGTNGGYKLAHPADTISALQVIRAIEGPVILPNCFSHLSNCDQSERCTVREPLRHIYEEILNLLAKMTIQELARSTKDEPGRRTDASSSVGTREFSSLLHIL